MVKCNRVLIPKEYLPEAYIIDEIDRSDREEREHEGLVLPPMPAKDYYDWFEQQDQSQGLKNVIIIEL